MAWYEKFKAYEEVTDANQSLVDGETSTTVTMNVWKYEADWSHVNQTEKDRQLLRRNSTVSTRT